MNWKLIRTNDPDTLDSLRCALAEAWENGRRSAVSDMQVRLTDLWADNPKDNPVAPSTRNPFRNSEIGA